MVVVSGPGWGEGMITRRESVVREEARLKVGKGGGENVVSTPSVPASEARGTFTVPLVVAVEVGGGVKGVTWLNKEEKGLLATAAAETAAATAEADSSHP